MSTPVIQPSFAAGEVSPSLFGRVDLAKYRTGVQTARNFFVDYRGGLSTRPGTALVGTCDRAMLGIEIAPCLIPFKFNARQTYVLELNDRFMRVITNGGYIVNTPFAVTGIATSNQLALTVPGHNFTVGLSVVLDDSVIGALRPNGVSGFNGRTFVVLAVAGNVVTLGTPVFSVPIDGSAWSAYVSGGTIASLYTVITPWAAADLLALTYAQSADVLTITHPNYPPYNIERIGQTNWQIPALTIGSALVSPTGQAATGTTGTPPSGEVLPTEVFFYAYAVTTFNTATGEESAISGACSCSNIALDQNIGTINTVTWTATPGADANTYYRVYRTSTTPNGSEGAPPYFYGYIGQTPGLLFNDVNLEPDFTTVAPTNQNPFTGGNNPGCVAYFLQRRVLAASASKPSSFWMSKPGNYNNYDTSYPSNPGDAITGSIVGQEVNAIVSLTPMASGLISLTADGAFQISGGTVGAAITPATIQAQPQAFSGAAALPPLKIEYDLLYLTDRGSEVRDLAYNFYVNVYTGTAVSALSSHLLEGRTIVQWAYANQPFKIVWCVRDDGILLAFTYFKEQELYGWTRHDTCGLVKSVCVIPEGKEDAVYIVVQRYVNGTFVYMAERMASRFMGANSGFNMPATVLDAWCVDSGVRMPVSNPNATIRNATPQAIRALGAPYIVDNIASGLLDGTYDTLLTDPTGADGYVTATVQSGLVTTVTVVRAGHGYSEPTVKLPNSAAVISLPIVNSWLINTDNPVFVGTMVGATLRVAGGKGVITNVNAVDQVVVNMSTAPVGLLPNVPGTAIPPAAPGTWSLSTPASAMGGLDHLNGALVSILADGSVQPPQIVVDGCITLSPPAADVTVGQGYTCQMQTLRIDVGEPTVQSKRKDITTVTLRVRDARGLSVGPTFSALNEVKQREDENYGDPIVLQSGGGTGINQTNGLMSSMPYGYEDQRVNIENDWNDDGVVCIEQANPLPATILAVIPEMWLGDTQ